MEDVIDAPHPLATTIARRDGGTLAWEMGRDQAFLSWKNLNWDRLSPEWYRLLQGFSEGIYEFIEAQPR